jgi:hypothetical protein
MFVALHNLRKYALTVPDHAGPDFKSRRDLLARLVRVQGSIDQLLASAAARAEASPRTPPQRA